MKFTRAVRTRASQYEYLPYDLIAIDQINQKPIIRVWHGELNQWDAVDIATNQKLEPTPDLLTKWNSATREDILKKLARLKQDSLRQKIGQFAPKLSNMATNFIEGLEPREIRDIHYQFLALIRNPTDRKIFEEMLRPPSDQNPPPGGPRPTYRWTHTLPYPFAPSRIRSAQSNPASYIVINQQRTTGDTLLAIYDQKAHATNLAKALLQRPHFYTGGADGKIQLPLPLTRESGPLRVWLAPQNKSKKDWTTTDAELMETGLTGMAPPPNATDQREIHFHFQTVLPGEYMLKAIWDKRRGFEDREKAGPGDYESHWIGPITITAGNTTSNLNAVCTNRAPTGGDPYYAADDLKLR